LIVGEIDMNKEVLVPSPTALKLFTFCFYIGKNTYHELVHMLFILISSLNRFHPDFFLVVYHNLGITIDDPRVRMVGGGVKGDDDKLLLEAAGCDGNVWVEGSAVRNRWHKLSFNKIHVFKNLYDEYGGACFTWIDLDTIVVADLSYLGVVDNYFVNHGGGGGGGDGDGGGGGGGGDGGGRTHDVLLGPGGDVLWTIPEPMYIQGSFWKLNLSLYYEVLRLDALFREKGVVLKYDLQSIFAVMAWGGGGDGGGGACPFYDGVSRVSDGSMLVIGENFMPGVMNGLGVWDTKNGVGNHVNTSALANMRWGGPVCLGWSIPMDDSGVAETRDCEVIHNEPMRRLVFRTMMYPDKEVHILSLTFDSFFMSNASSSSDFGRLFPFLLV
jgi:hypothetical protein